jgi:small subunit ribosomal protein S21
LAKIIVREGDSIERALKQFKRMCEKEGLRREIKRSSYYEKPSEKNRRRELQQVRERRKTVFKAQKIKAKSVAKSQVKTRS